MRGLRSSVCEFDILGVTLPEPSGEKDWRIWGRGGRATDLKATSTSGEDTTHMCGLSDTGSIGGISGSAEDESGETVKAKIDTSWKIKACGYIAMKRGT